MQLHHSLYTSPSQPVPTKAALYALSLIPPLCEHIPLLVSRALPAYRVVQCSEGSSPGLMAHQCGWSAFALTPLSTIRYLRSCIPAMDGRASRGYPFPRSPPQNSSPSAAARGQIVLPRFCSSDCSDHRLTCPPMIPPDSCCSFVMFWYGSKERIFCQVL